MKKKASYHHGDIPKVITELYLKLIKKKPAHEISIRELSIAAGVSHAAVYRYFKSRKEIEITAAKIGFEKLKVHLDDWIQEGLRLKEDPLKLVGQGYVDFAIKFPEYFRIMFAVIDPVESRKLDANKEAYKVLEDIVEQQDISDDKELISLTCWALVHGLATLSSQKYIDSENADKVILNFSRLLKEI